MTNNNYLEQVKADIKEVLEYDYDIINDIEAGQYQDADDLRETLYDDLWVNDGVTGNASGSYTFNRAEAREFVIADMDTVREALQDFGTPAEEIGNRFLDEDWEYLDVTARCYVLGQALDEVLEEMGEAIAEAFEAREEAE